jgi:hypothetical protein
MSLTYAPVKCGWDKCTLCNPNKKENEMSAVATVKTVKRTKTVEVEVAEKEYTLKLTEQQAGYFIDLTYAHLSGEVSDDLLLPLSYALADAGAKRIYASNDNNADYTGKFSRRYAVLKYKDEDARKAATGKKSPVF